MIYIYIYIVCIVHLSLSIYIYICNLKERSTDHQPGCDGPGLQIGQPGWVGSSWLDRFHQVDPGDQSDSGMGTPSSGFYGTLCRILSTNCTDIQNGSIHKRRDGTQWWFEQQQLLKSDCWSPFHLSFTNLSMSDKVCLQLQQYYSHVHPCSLW